MPVLFEILSVSSKHLTLPHDIWRKLPQEYLMGDSLARGKGGHFGDHMLIVD